MLPRGGDATGTIKMTTSEHISEKRKKKKKKTCLLIMSAIVAITVVLVTLGLTVFKSKDPTIQTNAITVETFSIKSSSLNLTLLLDLAVHNPNRSPFEYDETSTRLFYYGDPVGQTRRLPPPGEIRAKGSDEFYVLVGVEAGGRVAASGNLPGNIVSGRLPVVASTSVAGVVKVLGVFKHHALTTCHCDIFIFVGNATLERFSCRPGMKI